MLKFLATTGSRATTRALKAITSVETGVVAIARNISDASVRYYLETAKFPREFWSHMEGAKALSVRDNQLDGGDGNAPTLASDTFQAWMKNNCLHRDEDLPAVEIKNHSKHWFKDGVRHRSNGPAVVETDGETVFWVNGERYGSGHLAIVEYSEWQKTAGIPVTKWICPSRFNDPDSKSFQSVLGALGANGKIYSEKKDLLYIASLMNSSDFVPSNASADIPRLLRKIKDRSVLHNLNGPAKSVKGSFYYFFLGNSLGSEDEGLDSLNIIRRSLGLPTIGGQYNIRERMRSNGDLIGALPETTFDQLDKYPDGFLDVTGTKHHRLNGVPHHPTLPALVYADGTQKYYINGVLTRLVGPAIIRPNGCREFYFAPADAKYTKGEVEGKDNPYFLGFGALGTVKLIEVRRKLGLPTLPELDPENFSRTWIESGPAYEGYGEAIVHIKDGVPHRDGGPAKIWGTESKPSRAEYYQDGMLHNDQGPAVVDAIRAVEEFYRHGVPHNDFGPAKSQSTGSLQYWHKGVFLGANADGESKLFLLQSALIGKKEAQAHMPVSTLAQENLDRFFSLETSEEGVVKSINDQMVVCYHKPDGTTLHRVHGPAMEHPDGSYEWYLNGKLHREEDDGAPARYLATERSHEFYYDGALHRVEGPARLWGSPDADQADMTEWYQCGQRHRTTGPAIDGLNTSSKRYFVNSFEYAKKDFDLLFGITAFKESNSFSLRALDVDRTPSPHLWKAPASFKTWAPCEDPAFETSKLADGSFAIRDAKTKQLSSPGTQLPALFLDGLGISLFFHNGLLRSAHSPDDCDGVDVHGTELWFDNERPDALILHRRGAPARVLKDGLVEFYEGGLCHRIGAPAVCHMSDAKKSDDLLHPQLAKFFINGGEVLNSDQTESLFLNFAKRAVKQGRLQPDESGALCFPYATIEPKPNILQPDGEPFERPLTHAFVWILPDQSLADGVTGMPHRINGPAVVWADGDFIYLNGGKVFRQKGIAASVNGAHFLSPTGEPQDFRKLDKSSAASDDATRMEANADTKPSKGSQSSSPGAPDADSKALIDIAKKFKMHDAIEAETLQSLSAADGTQEELSRVQKGFGFIYHSTPLSPTEITQSKLDPAARSMTLKIPPSTTIDQVDLSFVKVTIRRDDAGVKMQLAGFILNQDCGRADALLASVKQYWLDATDRQLADA